MRNLWLRVRKCLPLSRTACDLELDGFLSVEAGTWRDQGLIMDMQMENRIMRIEVKMKEK